MRFCGTTALFLTLTVVIASAQVSNREGSGQNSTRPAAPRHHGTFIVELTKSLDSRKLKPGDPVESKLVGGITLPDDIKVPGGAKVIGHVIEAKARSKNESESSLAVAFDKIVAPRGEAPIEGVICAIAPNPNQDLTTGGSVDYGVDEEKASTVAGAPYSGQGPTPLLDQTSHGVLGIKNLQLDGNGILVSTSKDIKLDRGTRILLNVMMP